MTSDITIELVQAMATDEMVVRSARVSTKGKNEPTDDSAGLIDYLMRSRHGTPFEHNMFTFYAKAPIFVFREWHRHRIGCSINELSGRYSILEPTFYTPAFDRKMMNEGGSAFPKMVKGNEEQRQLMASTDRAMAETAWLAYKQRIFAGISNELARTIIPLNIYSQMYWTVNARSLMNFLSLRVESDDSLNRSRPQWEIQLAAVQMETIFSELMPLTHEAFVKHGRVAP
jgi:thymidylate synthase (FAD)